MAVVEVELQEEAEEVLVDAAVVVEEAEVVAEVEWEEERRLSLNHIDTKVCSLCYEVNQN